MTPTEALELSKEFPKNKPVQKLIYDALQQATEDNKKNFEMIIEGLYIDAKADEDFELLFKYFGE